MTPTTTTTTPSRCRPDRPMAASGSTTRSSARRVGLQGHRRPMVQRIERRELVLRALQHAEHPLRQHRRHPARHVRVAVQARSRPRTRRWVAAAAPSASTGRPRRTATGATTTIAGTSCTPGPVRRRQRARSTGSTRRRPIRGNVADQRNTNGESTFALYAAASGGAPRIYGLGAMQMFTPLSSAGGTVTSEFYLAQIDAVHAGKTVEIKLWDPGDTNPLAANLQIEIPTSGGWAATPFDWSATKGTTNANAPNCNALTPAPGSPRSDQRRCDRGHVQRLLADDRCRHPDDLHGAAERLVEDQVQHDRERDLERRHDLARPDPRQPRSSHRPLILSGGEPLSTHADSTNPSVSTGGFVTFAVPAGTAAMGCDRCCPYADRADRSGSPGLEV